MSERLQKFSIPVEDDEAAELLIAVREAGAVDVEQSEKRGISGFEVVVLGAIALPALANFFAHLNERWRSGVRVDARTERLTVRKDRELPRGSVLVVTKEGSQLYRAGEMSTPDLKDLFER